MSVYRPGPRAGLGRRVADLGTRASLVALAANLGLAAAKLVLGTIAGSTAVVADGFNSAGDVIATLIGLVGYRVARAPADDGHPFGHGNAESLAGLIIGGILLATGAYVALDGLRALASGPREPPELLALWVALGTAAAKEALYRYTIAVGRKTNSPALLASAVDHRADVLIALTVAAGVLGARLALPWLDPLAAVGVGLWISGLSVGPIRENLGTLLDASPPEATAAVRRVVGAHPEVRSVDQVRIHPLGHYQIVDLEIGVDPDLTLRQAHAIAHAVEDRIRAEVPHVAEVRVHVNPAVSGPGASSSVEAGAEAAEAAGAAGPDR